MVVNLYPFANAASNPETPFDELVEQIDIGGPSLLRAAGKNFRDVLVVVDPGLRGAVGGLHRTHQHSPSAYELMRKAIAHTGAYHTAISATLATIDLRDSPHLSDGARIQARWRTESSSRSRRSRIHATARTPTTRGVYRRGSDRRSGHIDPAVLATATILLEGKSSLTRTCSISMRA